MNYYIADLHLFHKNVTAEGSNFENRPFKTLDEMHYTIKENWNAVVTNVDHVYVLGDLSWKENEEAIELISTLRGNKHLILGNHDKAKDLRYRQLFTEILNYKEISDIAYGKQYRIVMSHFPIAFWNRQHNCKVEDGVTRPLSIHLYGHVHATDEEAIFQGFIQNMNKQRDMHCVAKNIGCMHWNYTPVTLEQILQNNK